MDPMFVVVLASLFVAAFIQRLAGFGYGLVAAPVALTMFTPFEVSFLMAFWGTMNSIPTLYLTRHSIPWRVFQSFALWLVLGLVVGYAGLLLLPVNAFKILAIVLCAQAMVSVFYPERAARGIEWSADLRLAGLLAGALQSSISIPGPPLVVAFNRLKLQGDAFVSLFALCFAGIGVVRIVVSLGFVVIALSSEAMAQRLPDAMILHAATGSAMSVLGVLLAQPFVGHVSAALFKKIAAVLIAVSVLTLIIDVLGWGPKIAALFA
ncbi:MAG: TSUP family transporter [Alphaproteobacteria bacterium]|jgi:uncharacterized membrane protein YfcA|nr:TSUP family transporter [Alphaproteobacteria bacterium]